MKTQMEKTRKLTESAVLLAFSVILSVLPVAKLPYGGSVTLASMFPLLLIAYRNGSLYGFGAGLCAGLIQQLLGLSNLSYFTTWQSIVAIILLDYLAAFGVTGVAGFFRKCKNQAAGMFWGGLAACLLRYTCHVISGATVWAGLSIPSSAALIYSLLYNATYMLPETVVLLLVDWYICNLLDFRGENLTRAKHKENGDKELFYGFAVLSLVLLLGSNVVLYASHLQDAESGLFSLSEVLAPHFFSGWRLASVIVSAVFALSALIFFLLGRRKEKADT